MFLFYHIISKKSNPWGMEDLGLDYLSTGYQQACTGCAQDTILGWLTRLAKKMKKGYTRDNKTNG